MILNLDNTLYKNDATYLTATRTLVASQSSLLTLSKSSFIRIEVFIGLAAQEELLLVFIEVSCCCCWLSFRVRFELDDAEERDEDELGGELLLVVVCCSCWLCCFLSEMKEEDEELLSGSSLFARSVSPRPGRGNKDDVSVITTICWSAVVIAVGFVTLVIAFFFFLTVCNSHYFIIK